MIAEASRIAIAVLVVAHAPIEGAAQSTPRGLTGSIEFSYDGPLLRARPAARCWCSPSICRLPVRAIAMCVRG